MHDVLQVFREWHGKWALLVMLALMLIAVAAFYFIDASFPANPSGIPQGLPWH